MAINPFFDLYEQDGEQELWNDLVTESIQILGEDVQYIPRNLVNFDRLLGADDSSRFDDTYTIEMQVINVMGFGGDKEFYSQFGHQVRDELTLSVNRERWSSPMRRRSRATPTTRASSASRACGSTPAIRSKRSPPLKPSPSRKRSPASETATCCG